MSWSRLGLVLMLSWGSAVCSAGGWVISGGDAPNTNNNPWFLANTKTVSYCIKVDAKAFHLDLPLIRQRLREAIDYWQDEFGRSFKLRSDENTGVGTQEFVERTCDDHVDIRFQFGYLTPEQRQNLKGHRDSVALSARTFYDPKTLRGRGFVYVAADEGPLRPPLPNLADRPWGIHDGKLLLLALVHELGHVFGIQHSNDQALFGSGMGLMSRSLLADSVDAENAPGYAQYHRLPDFFRFTKAGGMYQPEGRLTYSCSMSGDTKGLDRVVADFFGIPKGLHCLKTLLAGDILQVFAAESNAEDESEWAWVLVGTTKLNARRMFNRVSSPIQIWAPPGQEVFSESGHIGGHDFVVYESWDGLYVTSDGSIKRHMTIALPLNEMPARIMGIVDGRQVLLQ